MKILIAVPTYENIYPDTFRSIYDLETGEHDVQFEFIRGYDVAAARNRIAQTALDRDTDYVLMVDNDVVLPKRVLLDLLENPQDVTLGWYAHRGPDNKYTGRVCVCKTHDANGYAYHYKYPPESEYTAREMAEMRGMGTKKIRIHGGGMGCALIRTDVFRNMEYPWFAWRQTKDEQGNTLSEDLFFCEKCHALYIPIYTDTRAGCGHLFRYVQWPE